MPTHWVAVAEAVADLITADAAFRPVETVGSETPVFFGPALWWKSNDPAYVVIADSGTPESVAPAGVLAQTPGPIGAGLQTYDEEGAVECLAVVQRGDDNARAALDECVALVNAVHVLLRATPGLNLGTALTTARFMQAAPTMYATNEGVVIEIPFTVAYVARWRTP